MPTPDPNDLAMQWETFDVPLAKGVDLRSPARAVELGRLLACENLVFDGGRAGMKRRRGHSGIRVIGEGLPGLSVEFGGPPHFSTGEGSDPGDVAGTSWLYGWGAVTADDQTEGSVGAEAAFFAGAAKRDTENLAWDGFRLWSIAEGSPGKHPSTAAVLPVARTSAVGGVFGSNQSECEVGVGTSFKVVASLLGGQTLSVSVYDTVTGAPYLLNSQPGINASQVRVVAMGEWVHVLASTNTTLYFKSVHASDPQTIRTGLTTFGDCDTYFDARVISDTRWAVVKRDTSDRARITYLNADGSANQDIVDANTEILTSDSGAGVGLLSFAIHPVTDQIGLIYQTATQLLGDWYVKAEIFPPDGSGAAEPWAVNLGATTNVRNVTIEATYLPFEQGEGEFHAAYDQLPNIGNASLVTATFHANTLDDSETYYHRILTHHAFRVGHDVYMGVRNSYPSNADSVQLSYFLVDRVMRPVGRLEPGTASFANLRGQGLQGVYRNHGQSVKNCSQFHTTLTYRTRVDSENNDQFDEDRIKLVELDFLPQLRSAEFGEAVYFPGAQLSVYDGARVTEAGFHTFPEHVTGVSSNSTGSLTPGDVYIYKVRYLYRNAQGEETLSAALQTDPVTVGVGHDTITLTGYTDLISAKDVVQILVYRNESLGSQWYLVNSRDPVSADAVFWTPTASATWTFVDGVTDADLLSREKDPGDAGLLEAFSPPASEVIAAGRDRLWLAGGELPAGQLLPSFTIQGGKAAGFSQFLQTVVDRGGEAITAVGFMGHSVLVFQEGAIFAFEANGPNNLGQGSFDSPRKIVADTGAVDGSPAALTTGGVVYRAPSGYQLLANNYQVMDIGDPVRPLSAGATLAGVVTVPQDQEIRFYHSDASAAVFNYRTGEWTTWTGLRCAGAVQGNDGLARLAMPDGRWLVEADNVWTDAGVGYTGRFRLAPVRGPGISDFQRVRRVAILGDMGEGSPTAPSPVLRFQAFYNDHGWPEDEWTWDPVGSGDVNGSQWGDTTWGGGTWGDTGSDGSPAVTSRVMYARRRLKRQKCSRFVLDVSDSGLATPGPAYTAVSFELGRKSGLTRRNTTNS